MDGLLDNLNDQQRQAVQHTAGPLLIVAGAGTGKTTVVTRRIAHLVEQGLAQADEVLALTFTEKAAGEMQERLDLLLPLGHRDLWVSTFHSFCQRILELHGLDIGLPGEAKLVTETQAWVLIHDNLDRFTLDYYRPLGNPQKFVSALIKHFSKCKDELISPEDYLRHAETLALDLDDAEGARGKRRKKKTGGAEAPDPAEAARVAEVANAFFTYRKLLLERGSMDFADLINYTLELFTKRPAILRRYQEKFKYLMVDEFQDTNYAQYQLVKLLAGGHQNLVVVGDDDQSIYKFRGASVSNILKFKEDYPKFAQVTLTDNYRSGSRILDLAYRFIQANNPDRLEVKLGISKRLVSHRPEPGTVEVIEGKDLADELSRVAQKVAELKKQTGASWNDFAVLVRSNSAVDQLLPVLQSHGIPHTFLSNTGLYAKPIVADLTAYLSALDNLHDSFALYRALAFSGSGLTPTELSTLLELSGRRTLSLYEALLSAQGSAELAPETRAKVERFLSGFHRQAQDAQGKAANEVFVAAAEAVGLKDRLEAETLENAENRELVEQFYKKIEAFVAEHQDKSLHHFLHVLALEREAGDEGEIKFDPNLGPESLKVLTVHAAKGLEFEFVFLTNLVDQKFPTRARTDPIEIPRALVKDILPEGNFHLQEERRLFYVALTRAKSHLYLSWAKDYGGKTLKKPSLFLQELELVPGKQESRATGQVIFSRPKTRAVVYQKLPETFSFSALKAFRRCPLQYKYEYYLKVPTRGSAPFSFGQTIHRAFELFLKDYQRRLSSPQQDLFKTAQAQTELGSLEELQGLYKAHWIDEWYDSKTQKEAYRKKGLGLLKVFYEELKTHPPRPRYLEKSFRLPVGSYHFTGKIDRVDEAQDGVVILDYKTGKPPKKADQDDLDQLKVYQWAAEEYLGEKVTGMSYWYLETGDLRTEEPVPPDDLAALKAELLKDIERIVETVRYDLFKEEHKKAKDHDCDFEQLER